MKTSIDRKELFKWAGYLGAALLVGGCLRYLVLEAMGTFNLALLIAGGILFLIGIAGNYRAVIGLSGRRSTRLGANTAVLTIAAIAIIALLNFLSYRHHKRIDVTSEKLNDISDQTRKVVSGLTKDVKVIKFDQNDDPQLHDLMKEYRHLSNHITYERVDPDAKPDLARQYKVTGGLVVASDDRTERPSGSDEESLTSAIIKVTRDSTKKVYFIQGHGEKQISDKSTGDGYAQVDLWLGAENYQTKTVNLAETGQVPADCDILVVAGPKQSLFQEEVTNIGKYLDAGGKAMLLIDPATDPKLEDILKQWGLELGGGYVEDGSALGRQLGAPLTAPLATTYGPHSITKDFDGTMTVFPEARAVSENRESGSSASTTDLVKTSENSWATPEPKTDDGFNAGRDKRGPISLAVASTKSVGDKQARLVVIGNSKFANNQFARFQRNGDLFMNSINWLAEEESLISIRPKSPTQRSIEMSASQQNMLFLLTIFLMPAAAIGSGVYIWWRRR
jgi:ABC-type uncharacterized transport system involved in gliding motility auxiliary subunit